MSTADEIAVLKEVTREAHEAVQALKDARRDALAVMAHMKSDVEKQITDAVAAGLADYKGSLDRAIENATAATFARFDTIADILMGEARSQRRAGEVPLPEYARRIAEAREAPDEPAGS